MRYTNPESTPLTVALFATCVNDVMYPDTCIATVRLLERLGCRVEFPLEQSCCGQIFTNTGYHAEALGTVRAYVKAFSSADFIVGPSGSCVASVREQHPLLAAETGDTAFMDAVAAVVAKTYELTEFLIDVLGAEDVGAYFPHTVTFHPNCHAVRIAKVGDRPIRLLSQVRGLSLLPLQDSNQCCGFGGTFAVKNDKLSAAMVADKAAEVIKTGAEYLVNVDNACLMNIGGRLHREGSPVKTIHLAEILASTEEEPGSASKLYRGAAQGDGARTGTGGTGLGVPLFLEEKVVHQAPSPLSHASVFPTTSPNDEGGEQ